ncbi:hypothetical protein GUJ93_ZPchr0001g33153 [Zizania palustris]|uniref:Uncharacterized protein n=1 Tax=Zizania palustris TaxID=103762 RepID=A0A8J5S4W1_ZIZPA|nr:hypothetical protein GUJ93_ZPchr0001g33153 [Zizania palustris]
MPLPAIVRPVVAFSSAPPCHRQVGRRLRLSVAASTGLCHSVVASTCLPAAATVLRHSVAAFSSAPPRHRQDDRRLRLSITASASPSPPRHHRTGRCLSSPRC